MKKLTILCVIMLTTTFCAKKKEELIKEKVISAVQSSMKNPKSFEFVSYEVFKEIKIKEAKLGLPLINELVKYSSGEERVKYQKQIDFVNSEKNENSIAYYDTYLTASGTNSFGAIIQSKYYVRVINNKSLAIAILKEK